MSASVPDVSQRGVSQRLAAIGDRFIIDPRGEVIAGPAESGMIGTAENAAEAVRAAKAIADVGGHHSRPDIFRLIVERRPPERVSDAQVAVGMTMARSRAGQ